MSFHFVDQPLWGVMVLGDDRHVPGNVEHRSGRRLRLVLRWLLGRNGRLEGHWVREEDDPLSH